MRIISPNVEMMEIPRCAEERARHVELCGRVCYKSEDKIAPGSAEKFIARLIERGHEAMLEHSRVTVFSQGLDSIQHLTIQGLMCEVGQYDYLSYTGTLNGLIISGNMRAWRAFVKFAVQHKQNIPKPVLQLMITDSVFFPDLLPMVDTGSIDPASYQNCDPWAFAVLTNRIVHTWYSFRFTCDRGISHELVRHRPASFAQESTRYCNYSKGQFNGEITVIEPFFLVRDTLPYQHWKYGCFDAETAYFRMLDDGCSPQEARAVLPNSLKTEIIMTATAAEWLHFLSLRMDKAVHPQMREVATQAARTLVKADDRVFGDAVARIEEKNNGGV